MMIDPDDEFDQIMQGVVLEEFERPPEDFTKYSKRQLIDEIEKVKEQLNKAGQLLYPKDAWAQDAQTRYYGLLIAARKRGLM